MRRAEPRQVDGDLIDDGAGFVAEIEPGAVVVRVPRRPTPRRAMSTATHVPETSSFRQDELSADDARATIRRVSLRRLLTDSFRRLRYGDGFTNARALAFQFVLSLIPLLIAFVGLAATVSAEKPAQGPP